MAADFLLSNPPSWVFRLSGRERWCRMGQKRRREQPLRDPGGRGAVI